MAYRKSQTSIGQRCRDLALVVAQAQIGHVRHMRAALTCFSTVLANRCQDELRPLKDSTSRALFSSALSVALLSLPQ